MNTLTKQTVCIATEKTKKEGYTPPNGFIGKYGYFFTPEQLNEYTANVIKQTLETAAENAECYVVQNVGFIEEESITNTFEETYKKFEV